MNDIKNVSLIDAAPPNFSADAECAALLHAMEIEFRRIAELTDRLIFLPNIDKQPSEVVDALAYHYHLDFYDTSMPLELRRELVKNHNHWHRIKGAPAAVEKVIELVLGDGYVVEWFERSDMEPFTFEVHTSNASAVSEKRETLIKAVNAMKNARSHMTSIVVDENHTSAVYTGAAIAIYDEIRMEAET